MNDFFQNMLKQTNTSIANINDTIQDINRNLETVNNSADEAKKDNAAVETVDLNREGNIKEEPIINTEAAKEFLTSDSPEQASNAFTQVLTGNPAQVTEGVRSLLNWFNNLSLPFPIITNGATISTKNTFTDNEIDAMANAVGNGVAALTQTTGAFANSLYNGLATGDIGGAWQNAISAAASGLKGALSGGQIASINAYDGATAAGSDQEIARNQAAVAGGQAASEAFDSTNIGNAFGNAIGTTADGVGSALTGAASAAMNSVDLQATKDSLVAGLDAGWAGGGTALSKNANLMQNSVNNFLNAWGFNANGTWNGNVDPLTAIPQSLLAARDIAQTFMYIPQIGYDSSVKSIVNIGQNMIKNKNAQYGETTEVKHYTSLGDSVESGLGLQDYYAKFVNGESVGSPLVANTVVDGSAPDLVADALGAEAHQYHMPGARTSELLYMLDPDEYGWAMDPINPLGLDPMQGLESGLSAGQYSPDTLRELSPQVREDLAKSEVITLDIGWNDWWSMCYEGGLFRSTVQYALILKELYEINPDAEIVLVGGYNPFEGWDIIPGMDDNIFSYAMQGIFDVGLNAQKMVTCMLYPGKCTYADTRDTEIIQGRTGFFGVTLDDMGYNPHPTEQGAQHQANNILSALGRDKVYDEPDKGDYYKGEKQFQSADLGIFGLLNGIPSEYNYLQKGVERAANALRPNTVSTNTTSDSGLLKTMGVTQNIPGASSSTGTAGVLNAVGDTVKEMMTLSSGEGVNSHSSMVSNMAAVQGVQDGNIIGTAASSLGSAVTTIAPNLILGATSGLGSFLKGLIPGL